MKRCGCCQELFNVSATFYASEKYGEQCAGCHNAEQAEQEDPEEDGGPENRLAVLSAEIVKVNASNDVLRRQISRLQGEMAAMLEILRLLEVRL